MSETYTKDWPVIWRVVAPAAGSYDNDMVFLETERNEEASEQLQMLRESNWPVRLEKVFCGPLPDDYSGCLSKLRESNPQNPDTTMRKIPGAWEGAATD